ncbi:Exostosin-like protein [Melia azedarach]|uniref:Exostosin-like protein n=1 Tax=Melia azedarach TaxID=155640 RepID=A0ACC1Z3M4_MELAZ|nr:Exostosin-like protein [Melia azedarach]
MRLPNKKQLQYSQSTFWSSSSFLVLLLLILPLAVISVLVFTLAPASTTSFSPVLSRKVGVSGYSDSSVSESTGTTDHIFIANETIQLGYQREQIRDSSSSDSLAANGTILLVQEQEDISKQNESEEVTVTSSMPEPVKRYSKLEKLEASLARARSSIREAALVRNLTSVHQDPDYVPRGPIYRNANAFHRSYLEMEKLFKIYVYEEGEPPMFHNGPCKNIYSTEGRFIHEMEKKNNVYRTKDPEKALVYFLPFSVVMMVEYLYVPGAHEINAIGRSLVDYINIISNKYPFWNRSLGADHFMLSCHDWGPRTSSFVPHLFNKSIRVLCNANTSEGFNPSKDASLPEINLLTGEVTGLIGGPSPSHRSVLAFFAGRLHGHIRRLLLEQWKNKDEEVQVYDQLPKNVSYNKMLRNSKYCLCPSGYEVASPRVVEAIYAECVPVLISDSYVAPFSDVLNWKSFSVQIEVKDIPNIKKILMGISQRQYLRMQRRIKQVQRHFVVNPTPNRFDVFHMTLHSIWLRRLNIYLH